MTQSPGCPNPNCYDPRPHEHVVVADHEHPGFGMTGTRYLTPWCTCQPYWPVGHPYHLCTCPTPDSYPSVTEEP